MTDATRQNTLTGSNAPTSVLQLHHVQLDLEKMRRRIEARASVGIDNMAPPSQLAIATSVVNRLVKEEASYHKELEKQQASIAKLEQGGGDENAEYMLKQEVRSLGA